MKHFIRITIVTVITFCVTHLQSQNFNALDISVLKNNKALSLVTAGGLQAPQFSNIDFNNDGILDLFVFDKNGNQILPFVKTGEPGSTEYRFAPEYISQFPKLTEWALLEDYNKDGVMDIFTNSPDVSNSVALYKGIKNPDGRTTYQKLTFNYGPFPNILQYLTESQLFYQQVYVLYLDIPAILDLDDDGDIDIVAFDSGGGQVAYYKNLSVEENLGLDSVKYKLENLCWGRFTEDQNGSEITIGKSPFECGKGFTGQNDGLRHSGSTITILDTNGDRRKDVLIGDISSSRVKKLINTGTDQNDYMTIIEDNFPAEDVEAYIDDFLANYYVDADGDGVKDLIVTTNNYLKAENTDHIWLYKNIGTNDTPKFKLLTKNFLVDEMAYFYRGSHPTFADINADGLQDIVVGCSEILTKLGKTENRMFLLLNIGTAQSPKYEISDEDYLGFSDYTVQTGRFAPSFGDLDGDGDIDMMIGDAVGKLYYLENISGVGQPMKFAAPLYPYKNFKVTRNAKPQILDLDGDGLSDLILGKENFEINFHKNQGTKGSPVFDPNPDNYPNHRQLGNVFLEINTIYKNGAPYFIKTIEDKLLAIVGTSKADIKTFHNIEGNIYKDFDLLYNQTGNINVGWNSVPALADIDSDGYYEMVIGNERGGITFTNTTFKINGFSSTDEDQNDLTIELYPNPATKSIYVNVNSQDATINLLDLQGRHIQPLFNQMNNTLNNVASGIYFVQFRTSKGTVTKKLIITEE